MKPLRAADVKRAVDAAGRAITAVLETRRKAIEPDMLNSAGSVSAEWYIETLWQYLAKGEMLKGVSSFDVEFSQPAKLTDKQLHFAVPHPDADDLVMNFNVIRPHDVEPRARTVPVASIRIHRGQHRRRHGVAPDPPMHPYGIEVRRRHLNPRSQVSWYTMVSVTMDVARRGAQFADPRMDREDPSLLYVVPRFSFTPLADAAAQENLFVYPEFSMEQPWATGHTSARARVLFWAVANEAPWPIAESLVTVVRTSVIDAVRRPVDENGKPSAKTKR